MCACSCRERGSNKINRGSTYIKRVKRGRGASPQLAKDGRRPDCYNHYSIAPAKKSETQFSEMAEDDSNTDISLYGPSAIAQGSPIILLVEVERGLSADQRATSKLAKPPGASTTRRWVLDMLQPRAVSAILQSEPFLWRSYSIYILSEPDLSLYERVTSTTFLSLSLLPKRPTS